ncbi:MAG: GFA family protein [Pseudomonadales bacterium]|nr:GFA family protein [Pseudomonadales bacterium]
MINGSCLCGGVKFEFKRASGPMEICHCNRCRKKSGSSILPTLTVRVEDFTLLQGKELVKRYTAPILYSDPAYQSYFCKHCGSPVPPLVDNVECIEIPAGLLDNDPNKRPDKHIFVEFVPPWDTISDELPQYKIRDLVRERQNQELPENFTLRTHYD